MKSFMRANKWLIREFPEELGIRAAILATQFSSLFYFELRTPSLVYTRGTPRLGRFAMSAVAIGDVCTCD